MICRVIGLIAAALLLWLAATNADNWRVRVDDRKALKKTRSLGDVIRDVVDRRVHIVFVHGIRTNDPGSARTFMDGMREFAKVSDGQTPTERKFLDLRGRPKGASILGQKIWRDDRDWNASRPFVDRYVFKRTNSDHPVVVDEINWWPLVVPLKCRFLVKPDARLSGVDKADLAVCVRNDPPHHACLDPKENASALKGPGIFGGGAWANASLKHAIMNWGIADAVIALGPMRDLFRRAMDKAFDYVAAFDGHETSDPELVVVAESLGGFIVMDAAGAHRGPSTAKTMIMKANDLYFFANQLPLLELARIQNMTATTGPAGGAFAGARPEASAYKTLEKWANAPRTQQVIAFSDPSDLLTYDLPRLDGPPGSPTTVVNVRVRNEINLFGLFADLVAAHTGYSKNRRVLKMMFKTS